MSDPSEKRFRKLIELLGESYFRQLRIICAKIRTELVIPFCDKYNLRLHSGMGTYSLENLKTGESIYDYEDTSNIKIPEDEYHSVVGVLDLPAGEHICQNMGSLIDMYPNYTEKELKPINKRYKKSSSGQYMQLQKDRSTKLIDRISKSNKTTALIKKIRGQMMDADHNHLKELYQYEVNKKRTTIKSYTQWLDNYIVTKNGKLYPGFN